MSVDVEDTVTDPLSVGDVSMGTEPSSVYRIIAPAVTQDMVTFCDEANTPPESAMTGDDAVSTYDAEDDADSIIPFFHAFAVSVDVAAMVTEPLYAGDVSEGIVPSNV